MLRLFCALMILTIGLAGCQAPRYNADDHPPVNETGGSPPARTSGRVHPPAPRRPNVDAPVPLPWVAVSSWARQKGLRAPHQVSTGEQPVFEVRSDRGALTFQIGTRNARYNGMMLMLGFEPRLVDNRPCLHRLDLLRNATPLLLSEPRWVGQQMVVVIDPGHGGRSTGTRSAEGALEKHYALDWALRLKGLLKRDGWTVHLTRNDDTEVTLSNRVAFATSVGADLFLSLHFNASGGGTHQSGVETYCLTPTGMPSSLTRGYEDDLDAVHPNNAFDTKNLQLATLVHKNLLAVNGGDDRGIRRARFMTVLRGQQCPAVLVEGGFLSNPAEAARIDDPAYRQQLAIALANALQTHSADDI